MEVPSQMILVAAQSPGYPLCLKLVSGTFPKVLRVKAIAQLDQPTLCELWPASLECCIDRDKEEV